MLKKLLRSGDTLIPQGLLAGVLLWLGWQAQRIGWNVWGLGIAASCYCLFYLGTVLRRTTRENIPTYQRGIFAAAAFAVSSVLPPPTAKQASHPRRRQNSAAALTAAGDGSPGAT